MDLRSPKKEFPGLSLGTVYRNLKILAEAGLIHNIPCGNTFDRYDGDLSPHHHVTCERCGVLIDVKLTLDPGEIGRMEKQTGFRINPYPFELTGLCPTCQSK